MKSNRFKNAAVTPALLSLVLILFLAGCGEPDKKDNGETPVDEPKEMKITSVTIAPADNPGSAFMYAGGTLFYTITVKGENITSFDLEEAASVVIPASGVTIKSGAVTAADTAFPFSVLVDASFTAPQTLKLSISLFDIVSNEIDLVISESSPVTSVTVKANEENPGEAFIGTQGFFNFSILIDGKNEIFYDPGLQFPGSNVNFSFADGTALPGSFSISPFTITLQNSAQETPFTVSVYIPEGASAVYKLIAAVHGVSSEPFDVEVKPKPSVPLTGTVTMTAVTGSLNSPNIGTELRAEASGLPAGAEPEYHWAHGLPGSQDKDFEIIPGASGQTYVITAASGGLIIKAAVSSPGFGGYIYSNPTTAPTPKTVARQIRELKDLSTLPPTCTIQMVSAYELIEPQTLNFASDITITLKGIQDGSTLQLSGLGSMFTVGPRTTLALEDVTLNGISGNWHPVVYINGGGLTMNRGAVITGNQNANNQNANHTEPNIGGGVINKNGKLIMNQGSSINGNRSYTQGAGVSNYGSFELRGGRISNNFTNGIGVGSGVYNYGRFDMYSGQITGNVSYSHGSGVMNRGEFYMYDGSISLNLATDNDGYSFVAGFAGGVYNDTTGLFVLQGGEIRGNKGRNGGVYNRNLFAMTGGTIAGNYADGSGAGGVENENGAVFRIQGGIIYGSNAANPEDANKHFSSYSNQHALYTAGTNGSMHGTFKTNNYSDLSDSNFDAKGSLITTSNSIYVLNGLLQTGIQATSLTIKDISQRVDADCLENVAVITDDRDKIISEPLIINGTSDTFIFLEPFSAGMKDIKFKILDINNLPDYEEGDFSVVVEFTAKLNFQPNNTEANLSVFQEIAPPATHLTITGVPDGIFIPLEVIAYLVYYDPEEGEIERGMEFYGTTDGVLKFKFHISIPAGEAYFSIVCYDWDQDPILNIEPLLFKVTLISGDVTVITWAEIQAQKGDPHPGDWDY